MRAGTLNCVALWSRCIGESDARLRTEPVRQIDVGLKTDAGCAQIESIYSGFLSNRTWTLNGQHDRSQINSSISKVSLSLKKKEFTKN